MDRKAEEELRRKERKAHYDAADRNDKLIINFRDINHTMHFLYEGRGSQKRILIVLLEAVTITQRRLTKRLGIQPGSASEVLAKLEKGGLITRKESLTDRRTTDIMLTKQGEVLAKEAAAQRKIRHEEMFSCLTEEEKSTLLTLLEKVNADWRERYQAAEEHSCRKRGHNSESHHYESEGQ